MLNMVLKQKYIIYVYKIVNQFIFIYIIYYIHVINIIIIKLFKYNDLLIIYIKYYYKNLFNTNIK